MSATTSSPPLDEERLNALGAKITRVPERVRS
jgi:hypothetical protein